MNERMTELNPEKLARKIVAICNQKKENWGKYESSSVIFQLDTLDYLINSPETMFIQTYVYADLSLECPKTFFPYFFGRTCTFSYDFTIEFKKISMKSSKISQLQQIISKNNVEESMKIVERDASLTWDDL